MVDASAKRRFWDNLIPLRGSLFGEQLAGWTPGPPVMSGLGCTMLSDQPVPVADNVSLAADIYLPQRPGRYPAVVVFSAYSKELQTAGAQPAPTRPEVRPSSPTGATFTSLSRAAAWDDRKATPASSSTMTMSTIMSASSHGRRNSPGVTATSCCSARPITGWCSRRSRCAGRLRSRHSSATRCARIIFGTSCNSAVRLRSTSSVSYVVTRLGRVDGKGGYHLLSMGVMSPARRRIDPTRSTACEIAIDTGVREPLTPDEPVILSFSLTPPRRGCGAARNCGSTSPAAPICCGAMSATGTRISTCRCPRIFLATRSTMERKPISSCKGSAARTSVHLGGTRISGGVSELTRAHYLKAITRHLIAIFEHQRTWTP